jgi:hypothetical protein
MASRTRIEALKTLQAAGLITLDHSSCACRRRFNRRLLLCLLQLQLQRLLQLQLRLLRHLFPSWHLNNSFRHLNNSFDDDQDNAHADYIELSLQLQLNERSRSHG